MQFYEVEDIIRKLHNIEAILSTDSRDKGGEKSPGQLELVQLKRRITQILNLQVRNFIE